MAEEKGVEKLDASGDLKPDNGNRLNDELSSGENRKGSPAISTHSRSSFVNSNSYKKGNTRSFPQSDTWHYSHTGMTPKNNSLVYYTPTYDPFAFGACIGMYGRHFRQKLYFCSSGNHRAPVSSGSEAFPCNSWGSSPSLPRNENRVLGIPSTKASGDFSKRFSRPINQNQERYSSNKVSHYGSPRSTGPVKEQHYAVRNFSTFPKQRQDNLNSQNGLTSYQQNGRTLNVKDMFSYNPNREFEMKTELTCGPRSTQKYASLDESLSQKKELDFSIRREQYNRKDFIVDYNDANFFIIKSYSEDDIHKSIKYGVWTSTPNGNKRLDIAFRDAEARASDNGIECPIFLFFSVNGSGQFVGVAEMVGMVDFKKDMNFWKVDKWSGFFPVRWCIIKDVPNSQLRHIILKSNYNKPVTYTRDTHEVELKQGLEMLNIFKSYDGKRCLLDDFKFYENKEKFLDEKKKGHSSSTGGERYKNNNIHEPASPEKDDELGSVEQGSNSTSLVDRTRNLSLRESSL